MNQIATGTIDAGDGQILGRGRLIDKEEEVHRVTERLLTTVTGNIDTHALITQRSTLGNGDLGLESRVVVEGHRIDRTFITRCIVIEDTTTVEVDAYPGLTPVILGLAVERSDLDDDCISGTTGDMESRIFRTGISGQIGVGAI